MPVVVVCPVTVSAAVLAAVVAEESLLLVYVDAVLLAISAAKLLMTCVAVRLMPSGAASLTVLVGCCPARSCCLGDGLRAFLECKLLFDFVTCSFALFALLYRWRQCLQICRASYI